MRPVTLKRRNRGPCLVVLPENLPLAGAASRGLEAIGAWPQLGDSACHGLTEDEGHVLLGLALGYPVSDVRALHQQLSALRHSICTDTSKTLPKNANQGSISMDDRANAFEAALVVHRAAL